jgi:hypothetical protein
MRCGCAVGRWPSGDLMPPRDPDPEPARPDAARGHPDPELAHPEAAGWMLGILDSDDADRFAGHLQSCADRRAAVPELGPAARLLQTAAPAAVPPPGLQARTLAGVALAAAAARRGESRSW